MFARTCLISFAIFSGLACETASAQQRPIEVAINVQGEDTAHLKSLLDSLSEVLRIRKQGAGSLGAVRRLASGDVERFARALNSEGFYAAKIDSVADTTEKGYTATFTISTGHRFTIASHAIEYADAGPTPDKRPKTVADTGASLNDSSRGPDILKIEKDFLARLQAQGYPLAKVVDRRAEVKSDSTNARLVYRVESGPHANFGKVVWKGTKYIHTKFLDKFVNWKPSDTYSLDQTTKMRDELSDTGLFTRVEVTPGPVDSEGNAPVVVDIAERKRHTIAGGVSYSTNLGPGVTATWVDRNLLGSAEKYGFNISFARDLQYSTLLFEKPRVLARTDLVTKLTATHEDDEAFRGKTVELIAGLKHVFGRSLTASAGVDFDVSDTVDPISFTQLKADLIGFPVGVVWSTIEKKDILDPKRGISLGLTITPTVGSSHGPVFFTLTDFLSSYHWPFDKNDLYIGGLWLKVGASIGPGVSSIPPDKRYYAGGAGSVRGYGYRLLGPTDSEGKPIGGRSVLEGGGEFRFPILHNLGGAIFAEAGGVDETGLFTFKDGIRESIGAGIRYATVVGPIRVDAAFPLERRQIDKPFQIYVGLGQAF